MRAKGEEILTIYARTERSPASTSTGTIPPLNGLRHLPHRGTAGWYIRCTLRTFLSDVRERGKYLSVLEDVRRDSLQRVQLR